MRTVLILLGFAVVAVLGYRYYAGAGAARQPFVGPAMLAGAPAATFVVKTPTGGNGSLADYRGKVVLVNLWATWCPPCREELPSLERLYRNLSGRGFVVLGIDQGESAAVAADYARKLGVSFPLLFDESQEYGRAYAAQGLPTSILVDRAGRIVKGIDGEMTFAQMSDLVTPALRAK